MDWKLAPALKTLRRQIDEKWPDRSKDSDGTVGDPRHQARKSDHNPNWAGVVCAIDITRDDENGPDCEQLALSALRDPRVAYVIYNRRIASRGGTWRKYGGSNPHTKHVHISLKQKQACWDDSSEWELDASEFSAVGLYKEPTMPLVKSNTFRAAAAGIGTAVLALLNSWQFWFVLILIAIFGYIIWERNGKPDIYGWVRQKVIGQGDDEPDDDDHAHVTNADDERGDP